MGSSMGRHILLVDDEEDIRLVLKVSLIDMGYEVITAENGREALRLFLEHRPPIVVTDIKMPDIDGLDLLRKIKNENPDTEVVMITGHGDMDMAIESFQEEATDFITKPINVEALEKALYKVEQRIEAREMLREYTRNLEKKVYEKSTKLAETEGKLFFEQDPTQLRNIQKSFQSLFRDLPCFLVVLDMDLYLAAANEKTKEAYGDCVGKRCYQVFMGGDAPCPNCPALESMSDGETHQQEMEYLLPDDQRLSVLVWSSPMRDVTGEVTRVLVMATELSQIMQVQDNLASLGLMISSLSHGIKGLLTGLDGGMYLLDSGLKKDNDAQVDEGLKTIKLMVGRIRNLVLDILMFSKERDLRFQNIRVHPFASELAAVIEQKARAGGIEFVKQFEVDQEHFEVDSGFLRTALINVLENALEACPENRNQPCPRVEFGVAEKDDRIVFTIQDTGPGIPPEAREKMFDLFYSSKSRKGTGLGLYITNKIVKQHQGRIEVDSKLGEGTRFKISIPVSVPVSRETDTALEEENGD